MDYKSSSIDWTFHYCCDIHGLVVIYQNKSYNDIEVSTLFDIIKPECINHVEFIQFANEVIFLAIKKNPTAFLVNYQKSKNKEFILDILENPISDNIDLSSLIERLNEFESYRKTEIITRLEVALSKYKKE
jgi:hypothetical protein